MDSPKKRPRVGLFVPTYNAGKLFHDWVIALDRQTLRPDMLYAIDSSSKDDTVSIARQAGFAVDVITQGEFNHGGTRNRGVAHLASCDLVVFLTQDALLERQDALKNLVKYFDDPDVSAVYGRQLPHKNAHPIGAHARMFNYPDTSRVKSKKDIPLLGLKAAFCSNSFAAYRTTDLEAVGGFPLDVIFGEDMYVAARLILAGYKVAYCGESVVHHSHDYGFQEEFRRYFDIGVLHSRQPWLRESFGSAEGEGIHFVKSELAYLAKSAPWLIPSALLRSALKLIAYRVGLREKKLPLSIKTRLTMNRSYWGQGAANTKPYSTVEPVAVDLDHHV